MCRHVSEVAGEVILQFLSDRKNGGNINKSYTIYGENKRYNSNYSNSNITPIEYINNKKLSKVRKRQY